NGQIKFSEKQTVPDSLIGNNPLKISPKLRLALEKIMVEYYAYCGLDLTLITDRLNTVYTLDEGSANVTICNFNQQVRKPQEYETSHLLVLRSNPQTSEIYAYLELFNVICAYTVLVSDYKGPDISFVFHQDVTDCSKIEQEIKI